MPPRTLFDITGIDLDTVIRDQESIRSVNPQRYEMEHLNAITHINKEKGEILGYKDVKADEFWVPGHIPGRPLLPGVIMIEAAAQISSFYTKHVLGVQGFIGFGGIEECKFRNFVPPGSRLYLLSLFQWHRHSRICSLAQGLINGNIAFEAKIIGTVM